MRVSVCKSFTLAFLMLLLFGCAKQEITSDKANFVGVWTPVSPNPDNVLEITINQDGTGRYFHAKPGTQVEFRGNVYFQGFSQLTIGGKIIKKKIKINKPATKVVESLKPYKYHYEAQFDGINYTRPN